MNNLLPTPLAQAKKWADVVVQWLTPHCDRIDIVGSIRRQRPYVNDIDIVCIPKVVCTKDLLGNVTDRFNAAFEFMRNAINEGVAAPISGCKTEGKQMILQLKKIQLDLWFASETNWSSRLMMRTGSKEHNIWLCERAKERGLHWNPYEGLSHPNTTSEEAKCDHKFLDTVHCVKCGKVPASSEADIYRALGLPLIEPANREIDWLKSNI